MADIWQTLAEACQTLGISQRTLYRRIDKDEIESKLEDKRRMVLVSLPDDKLMADSMADVADTDITALKDENEDLKQQLQERDSQIDELQAESQNLRELLDEKSSQLHDAEKQAILTDELSADKERLQQQLDELQEDLRQSKERADTITLTLTQQLEQARQPFWRRWRKQKKALPAATIDMGKVEDEG